MKAYRITIQLQEVHPLMWREVLIPAKATFAQLHQVIQRASDFQGASMDEAGDLYEFNLPEEKLRITNDEKAYIEHRLFKENREAVAKRHQETPEEYQAFNEARLQDLETAVKKPEEVHLGHYLEKHHSLEYIYDYVEKWRFIVAYVETVEDYSKNHPTLINGAEAAPIKNIGGAEGYIRFLEVYRDPQHPENQALTAWAKEQGFREYDKESINKRLTEVRM